MCRITYMHQPAVDLRGEMHISGSGNKAGHAQRAMT